MPAFPCLLAIGVCAPAKSVDSEGLYAWLSTSSSPFEVRFPMIALVTSLIGLFFILTALLKAFYSRLFIVHVRRFRLFPERPAALLAILLIEFEAGLGAAILLGIYPELLIPLAGCLVLLFTLLNAWGYRFRQLENCGCYGGLIRVNRRQSQTVNVLLAFMLGVCWYFRDRDHLTDPRHLYYVICLVLIVHLLAKKTVVKPAFDLLRMKIGKPWNRNWFDIDTENQPQACYLFFFLDRQCLLCRAWIHQLERVSPEAFRCRMVVLTTAAGKKSSLEQDFSHLQLPVQIINENVMRLLSGQLPLAVSVNAGMIVAKWSGSFPEGELLKHLIPEQTRDKMLG